MSTLLDDLLAVPVAGTQHKSNPSDTEVSRRIEVSPNSVDVLINDEPGVTNEGTARKFLNEEGLDPEQWEVASFRKSEWEVSQGPDMDPKRLESSSFTFKPVKQKAPVLSLDIDGMLSRVKAHEPLTIDDLAGRYYEDHPYGFLIALGDMQFGKADGDGPEGALNRAIACLNEAADQLVYEQEIRRIDHVHIAWLGDHIEGFQSQGGANAWRTVLTLTEQIRLTRRVMEHALFTFAPLTDRLTMAAVPGNHGETVRFEGKGITRYDDSHDTEALVAVSDAAKYNHEAFGHVEFYVPDRDEMTVVLDVAGTRVAHVHGHQWRPGKQFDWWQGQSFNRDSLLGNADILLAGHLHHAHIEEDTDRMYVGVPALESESTWFKHSKGTGGCPGILTAVVSEGRVESMNFVRSGT